MDSHCKLGDCFFEFKACTDVSCVYCRKFDGRYTTIDSIPQPVPNWESGHYTNFSSSVSLRPDTDEYQPRVQADKMIKNGLLNANVGDSIDSFCDKYLVGRDVLLKYITHVNSLKHKASLRKAERQQSKAKVTVAATDSVDTDSDTEDEENVDSDNDVILNAVDGSETEDDDDDDDINFVPAIHTVTRHGRLAGTWKRVFHIEDPEPDPESDSSSSDNECHAEKETEPSHRYVTRSGRKAGTWKRLTHQ